MLLDTAERISYDSAFWDNPYSIVVVFSFFILLYVIAALIKKMKQPRKQIKTVQARVESVRSARAQLSHGNISIDGMRNGSTAIPGALFDVTFIEELTGEIHVFSINERMSEKFKIGDKGMLKYNGDEFISFLNEHAEKEIERKAEQKYRTKKFVKRMILGGFAIALVAGIVVIFWMLNQEDSEEIMYDANGERLLIVYVSGEIFHQGREDEFVTSWYQLGDMPQTTEKWGDAHIFRDAIEQYKKQTNEDIIIKYFDGTEEMLRTAHEEWQKGKGPDVLLGDYMCEGYSLYPYIEEGMFENILPYFENDEIYSGDQYISKVLEAGLINEEQLIFPLTFNMNVLFTSKERMQKHEIWLSDDMYYEDMLDLFRNEWRAVRDENEYLMVQFTNMRNNYPYILFQSASGDSPVDYETGKITLRKESFTDWATLYQSYICDEYDMTREELRFVQEGEGLQEPDSKYGKWLKSGTGIVNERFGLIHENVLCFAEGGNCSFFFHSFAANARYFESRFDEFDDDMICIGVPTSNNPDGYAAQVTTFGVVLANSPKADQGYELIKTIADSRPWMHFDLSVNKQSIEETLTDLSSSYYDYYPALGRTAPPKGEEDSIEWLGDSIQLKPMSSETKEYLQYMIDHIEVATLPEYGLNKVITEEIQNYLWGDTESIDEAYQNTIARLVELGYTE
ncbi:MAG: hypothetical protein IJN10_05230 [Firmicutes bacterium]|nr:hypothetical protein [Bacillota bacterium]